MTCHRSCSVGNNSFYHSEGLFGDCVTHIGRISMTSHLSPVLIIYFSLENNPIEIWTKEGQRNTSINYAAFPHQLFPPFNQ